MRNNMVLIAFFLVLLLLPPKMVSGEAEIIQETKEILIGISEEEKAVLEILYSMEQEISALERESDQVSEVIENYQGEIKGLETEIQKEETSYANNRDVLKEVLKSYQRLGPGNFLEILLDSDSIATFLRRVNTLRDLTRNTGELMVKLDESKAKLVKEKAALAEKLLLQEEQQKQLQELLAAKVTVKKEKEAYLASLELDRTQYEDFLEEITLAWQEVKPVFVGATHEFSRLVEEGSLPPEALEIGFSGTNIKGTIKETSFNEVIVNHPELPKMVFKFEEGKIELSVPTMQLSLRGNFEVEGVNTLKYVADEGAFYEMTLSKDSLEELFEEGYLVLALEPLIGNSIVEGVESKEGQLELFIKPDLF